MRLWMSPYRLLVGLLCVVGLAAPAQTITSILNNAPGMGGLTWIGLAGDQVQIQGNGFSAVSEVRFNGVLAPGAGATTSSTILATVPAGAANSTNFVSVKFMNNVTIFSPQQFVVPPSGPYVRSFSPTAGSAGTPVTFLGTRFTGVTSVRFRVGNTNLPGLIVLKSETTMEVDAPAGVSTGPITVVSNTFTHVTASNFFVAPVITGFTPTNGRTGTNVTLTGTNFTGATAVLFGALPAASYTVLANTQLVATVPNNAVSAKISISAPAGTAFTTNNFKVLPNLVGFTPNFGPPGTPVLITGTNLNEGSGAGGAPQVFFNGVAATIVTNVSFTQLTAVVPNGATTGNLSVTTTNGSGTNNALFHLPAFITGVTPNTNPPGTRVRIDGTNFLGATAVIFANNVPSPSFTVTNNNIIGAEVPGGLTTGNIKVVTPAGTNTSTATYFAAPQISSFNPLSGLPGDFPISVFGNNLGGATAVRFSAPGGFVNATILGQPPGRIDVVVPSGAMTGPISVVGPAGIGFSAANFTLNYSTLQITVTNTPNPASVGSPVTYAIQVKNLGPNPATVLATNILPASVAFSSSTAGTTVGGTTAVNLGTVGVNATASFSVTGIPSVVGVFVTNATTASSGPLPAYPPTNTIHFVEPPALLRAEFYPPASLLLSWPTLLSNYGLQFRTNLALGNWSPVPTPPTVNNGTNTVTEPMTNPERFYRLKR